MNSTRNAALAVVATFALAWPCQWVRAQGTGTILGSGTAGPGQRDSTWKVVAYPNGFAPPSSQTAPYNAYVPTNAPGVFVGGGTPQ